MCDYARVINFCIINFIIIDCTTYKYEACRFLQVFAVVMAGHVHDLFSRDTLDLPVKPWLIRMKSLSDLRHELLTLRTERVVKFRTLHNMQ